MRRARVTSIGKIEIDNACPEPIITSPEQILVKVRYAGINADDYNVFSGTFASPYDDRTLLHEMSGEVVALGPEAAKHRFAIGDRVSSNICFGCGVCPMCRKGKPNLCLDKRGVGASSDYIIADAKSLVRLPDSISLKEGSLYWLATSCIRCVERIQIEPDSSVLILGGGSAGLTLLQLVKKRMPSVLAVSEPIAYKRNLALKLGADYVINPLSENVEEASLDLTSGLGFDVVIDASGALAALENVTELIARGGKLMLFSYYHIDEALRLNLMETYWKELTILSSYGAVESYYTTAASKAIQYLDIKSLISEVIPFEEMQTALEMFGTREKLRLIVKY